MRGVLERERDREGETYSIDEECQNAIEGKEDTRKGSSS
jgi:hypothetical protein